MPRSPPLRRRALAPTPLAPDMGAIRNREEQVYAAVIAGEILIEPDGSCWRVAVRQGNRGKARGVIRVIQCAPRRAEDVTRAGYLQIRVMVAGKRWQTSAHRLVWRHFNGPLPPGRSVLHKSDNKTDNRLSNLKLGIPKPAKRNARRGRPKGRK
jgi:HNH endonuclease